MCNFPIKVVETFLAGSKPHKVLPRVPDHHSSQISLWNFTKAQRSTCFSYRKERNESPGRNKYLEPIWAMAGVTDSLSWSLAWIVLAVICVSLADPAPKHSSPQEVTGSCEHQVCELGTSFSGKAASALHCRIISPALNIYRFMWRSLWSFPAVESMSMYLRLEVKHILKATNHN